MKTNSFLSALVLFLCFPFFSAGQDKLSKGEHFAPVNGISIHYYVSGSGPVCLVPSPGWGPSVDYLKNSLTQFESFFTMVYYDTRLSGQSTGPDDQYEYTSRIFMKDMDGLRQYLELSRVWLMGHSAGGFQVLYYAIHHNNRLNGIIALSPFAALDDVRDREYQSMLLKRRDLPGYEKGYDILSGNDKKAYTAAERLQYTLPFYFHDTSKIPEFQRLSSSPVSSKADEYTATSGFGLEYLLPKLHKIKVPALIVVGDDDFICDRVSQSDRIASSIKSCTEILINDAGHFSWIEQPEQFFPECTDWLKKHGVKQNSGK